MQFPVWSIAAATAAFIVFGGNANPAFAVSPSCIDAAGNAASRYYSGLIKEGFFCTTAKQVGKVAADANCLLIDLSSPSSESRLIEKTDGLYQKFSGKIADRCDGEAALGDGFGSPCSTVDGVATIDDLRECLATDQYGASAARIQQNLFGADQPITDPALQACAKGVAKAVSKLAKSVTTARRTCGRDMLSGGDCDADKLDNALLAAKDKATAEMERACGGTLGALLSISATPVTTSFDACVHGAAADEVVLRECVANMVAGEAGTVSGSAYPRKTCSLQMFNVDDQFTAKVNGQTVLTLGYHQQGEVDLGCTGVVDLALHNALGGWTYGWSLVCNGQVAGGDACGQVGVVGCQGNVYTTGLVYSQSVPFDCQP